MPEQDVSGSLAPRAVIGFGGDHMVRPAPASRHPASRVRALARSAALALALAAATGIPDRAHAAPPEMVRGEVLVRFRATAAASDVQAILDDLGATRLRRFPRIRGEHHRITRRSVEEAIERFRTHPAVEIIEPNWIVHADVVPDDPDFDLLWGLRNTGQTGGLPGADIGATRAWDVETGSPDVVVAILDTGVDYIHPDLAANVWTNPGEIPGNQVDDDGNGFADDVHGYDFFDGDGDPMDEAGHGTHVAGTIAAVGNNGVGITGVAWNVTLMPLRFLGPDGSGPTSAAIECVEYAIQMGAHVLNNSWGGAGFSSLLEIAIRSADQRGIPFVAAAGNDGLSLDQFTHYPASYDVPNVIAVASTTHQDLLSFFSNFGAATVHLAAPGSSIRSTLPGGMYGYDSGTSMSAPHVSGALALLRSEFPGLPGNQLKAILLGSVDPIPALAGLVASGGRLNVARMLSGPDSIAPARVTTLAAHEVDSDRVTLRWIATGDDGAEGQARRYDLRFDTAPIDESSFDRAQVARSVPMPGPAGTTAEATIEGLRFQTSYSFAVKVIDEFGNASPLSNVASARTIGPPEIETAPDSLDASLQTGGESERVITIRNAGTEGTLEFATASATPASSGSSSAAATADPGLELAKGEPDPRAGDPVTQGRGGPDGFGYQWIDSDETGGPAFHWEDIRATGTAIPIAGDDEMSSFVPIGFLFPFYDNLYAFVRVSTNGFLSFSSGTSEFTNQRLPSASAPENMVAPFWDDLAFSGSSAAHAWSDGERFVVQWSDVFRVDGGGPYTFQAILQADGTLTYQYLEMDPPVTSATVGIQDATRSIGLTVAFNTSYVHPGLAVRIHAAPRWLTVAPPSGRLAPGQSATLTVRLDASHLPGGSYEAAVRVTSNDPVHPLRDLPVRLTVGGAADIAFASPALAFLQVFVGSVETQPLTVSNEGFLPLEITSVGAAPSVFETEDVPFTLEPGASRDLPVRFRPVAEGLFQGALTVTSNDPDEGVATVALTGSAILPPDVTVTPSYLRASVRTGETATREISITNAGASSLRWTVVPENEAETDPFVLAPPSPEDPAPDGAASQRDPARARTDAITAELVSLEGIRVLFDGAHENAGTGAWSRLIQDLALRGATVTRSTSPITRELLAGCDVLWITDSRTAWSPEELVAAREWLTAGGGVLLEGDNAATIPVYNALLAAAGTGLRYQEVRGASGITHHVYPHVVTRDVAHVNLDANLATLTGIDPPAALLVEDLAGQPSAAAVPVGAGRVLALADEMFSDFHSAFADNQLLANQAFDWLSGMTWLRVSPSSGVTPPGGASAVTVAMDALGLEAGDYVARLVVASDDPDEAEIRVPVSLGVTRLPSVDAVAVDVEPHTLHLGSRGRWALARVELPAHLDPALTDPSTVRWNGVVPVDPKSGMALADFNGNGVPDLELRFDRAAVEAALPDGDRVPVTITGEIRDFALFTARDSIRVLRPRAAAPDGGEILPAGAVETEAWTIPVAYALHRNAPNPFHPETWIRFDMPRAGHVTLRVHAVDGRVVWEWRENLPAGRHRVRWDGRTAEGSVVASGVYFARLLVDGGGRFQASRRMLIVR